jgi:hypothetical protein
MENTALVAVWRATIQGATKSWVLFKNGTCVILMEPKGNLAAQATGLLQEWGPVGAGTSFGDFSTIALQNGQGWVVTCHHDDILTFVGPDEIAPDSEDVVIGLYGRAKRGQDAEQLHVSHVEDNRTDAERATER